MKGRIPVTLESLPQADADFLLDIGRVDSVLAKPVTVDQGAYLGAVIRQEAMQARAQGGVEAHAV
jgi:hypothetical protein